MFRKNIIYSLLTKCLCGLDDLSLRTAMRRPLLQAFFTRPVTQ